MSTNPYFVPGQQMGDDLYSPHRYNYLEKYKLANMENQANYYGEQAQDMGDKADATEASMSKESGSSTAGMGQAIAGADSTGDAVSGALLASGNPYAMAAGGALKVASMGQKREQERLNASRAAFIDRQNRMRDASDKLMSMNFGV